MTCLAGEVQLNGLDTDVLRTSSHDLWCGCVVVEGGGQVAWGLEGRSSPLKYFGQKGVRASNNGKGGQLQANAGN